MLLTGVEMDWVKKALGTLFVILLTTIAVPVIDEWVKPLIKSSSIYIDVYASEWQPYPVKNLIEPKDLLSHSNYSSYEIEELSDIKLNNFSIILVFNKGFKEVTDVTIQLGDRFEGNWAPDALISFPKSKIKRQFYKDVADIKLPPIPPGKYIKIYLWHKLPTLSDYNFGSMRAFTLKQAIPIHFYKYLNYEDQLDGTPYVVMFFEKWVDWIIYALIAFMLGLLCFVAVVNESYYKELLKKEDFYLNEKIKFDKSPNKFQINLDFLSDKTDK